MKKALFSLLFVASVAAVQAQCSDVFFSEYVEGSGNSKAVEIYNPTANPINLSQYTLKRYSNGGTSNPDVLQLSGMIQPYDVVVVVNGQTDTVDLGGGSTSPPADPALQAMADILDNDYPAPCYFNGDDALTIEKGANIIDIFGKVGEDPGGAWTTDTAANFTDANGGRWWTRNHTLIRKANVEDGITNNPSLFNPAVEYDSLPEDTWEYLGAHDCTCDPNYVSLAEYQKAGLSLYPNPAKSGSSITLSASERMESYEVYSLVGQQIAAGRIFSPDKFVTLTGLKGKPGVYFVQVRLSNGETVTKKFILQ